MTITFATLIFTFLFLFKGVQKNTFYLLYAMAMIVSAYCCETHLGWHLSFFSKTSFMLFILFHLVFINFFTFCAYGKDKRNAQRGEWRIPEIQLHTLELLGGTVGAVLGQRIFHHKNKKRAYRVTFYIIIVIQACLILFALKQLGFY